MTRTSRALSFTLICGIAAGCAGLPSQPAEEQVRLVHVSPADMAEVVTQLMQDDRDATSRCLVRADPRSQSVFLSGSPAGIAATKDLIALLDVPSEPQEQAIIRLGGSLSPTLKAELERFLDEERTTGMANPSAKPVRRQRTTEVTVSAGELRVLGTRSKIAELRARLEAAARDRRP